MPIKTGKIAHKNNRSKIIKKLLSINHLKENPFTNMFINNIQSQGIIKMIKKYFSMLDSLFLSIIIISQFNFYVNCKFIIDLQSILHLI